MDANNMTIDYDKLKQAHELNKKATNYSIMINLYPHTNLCFYALYDLNQAEQIDCKDIDDLISKLKELTQPEPKYEDGQEVWLMYTPIYTSTMQPGKFKTDAHKYEDGVHQYCLIGNGVALTWREENTIYPTREALIDAQIEYWTCLKNEETSICSDDVSMECEHESNSTLSLYRM